MRGNRKRRTIVKKKEVSQWVIFEGRFIGVGFVNRKQARIFARKMKVRPGNHKYVGRSTHGYRYIILDTH